MNEVINHAAYKAEKEHKPKEPKCSTCLHYVGGFCIGYRRSQPVFPTGTCYKHKPRK